MTSATGKTRGYTPAPTGNSQFGYSQLVRGYTFIEILFVVIIVGILVAVSLPGFRNTFSNLQLNNASSQLQSFMNYLAERAVVEGKIIYFNIDSENKEFLAKVKDTPVPLKTYSLPKDMAIETDRKQVFFYPDGSIDNVTVKLTHPNNKSVTLTTKGVYGRVKLQED